MTRTVDTTDDFRRHESGWLTARRFAFGLFILIAIGRLPVLAGKECFIFRDFGLFGYPVAAFFRDSFWQGQLPFWNPYNNCGLPFLAQWNAMVFYPPSLFYLEIGRAHV